MAVLDAAEGLGYRANGLARRLASGRTRTCGVVVTDLHNPFYAEVLDGINGAARDRDFRVLVVSGERPAEAAEAAETLLELRVEGLLLLGSPMPDDAIEQLARQVQTVVVGSGPAQQYAGVDTVVSDDFLGAKLAVDHLVALGHRRIAHLTDEGAYAGRERRAGYEQAMAEAGFAGNIALSRETLPRRAVTGPRWRRSRRIPESPRCSWSTTLRQLARGRCC